jgi:hypothetical protein
MDLSKVKKNTTDQFKPAFKLQIDSKLIRSNSSALPDELRDLGVCAYDEQDFEKGVLSQVDKQIAEYESHKKRNQNQIDNETSQSSIEEEEKQPHGSKRRSADTDEIIKKKAKLFSSLSENDDTNQSDSNDIESMIKKGEMTPFGTLIEFDKETTVTSNKKKNSDQASTDFDSFLMDLDKKPRKLAKLKKQTNLTKPELISNKKTDLTKEPVQSIVAVKPKNISYVNTENTDFDNFLNSFDNNKPKTSNQAKMDEKLNNPKKLETASKIVRKNSDALKVSDFDKCLFDIDTTNKKSKKTTLKSNKTIDPMSFMQIMQDTDDNDSTSITSTTLFDTTSLEENDFDLNSVLDSATTNNDVEEENYDDITNDKNYEPNEEESDIDYVTDDEDNDDYMKKKRKKKRNKNCMDDGDDKLYAKRMKRLERYVN